MTADAQTPRTDETPHNVGNLAMLARQLERELAAVRGQLEESAKTGLKYMAQAADETRLRERAESALAAAKAEAEELRKELADRPSVGKIGRAHV